MEFENLLFEARGKIALITMNRPQALNAFDTKTLKELDAAVGLVESDAALRGAIVTGQGKAFVAGADIAEMSALGPLAARDYIALGQKTFCRIEQMPKPFIAAVNGFAIGGGCELALACDIRIASEKASFGQPEANFGIIPGWGGTQRLPRLVGSGIARELLFTARTVKADEALSLRLVNRVVPPEALLDEAFNMMETIVAKPANAIAYAKTAITRGAEMDLNQALELEKDLISLLFSTDDQKEGMKAFLEKRQPAFKGL
jgi:enoyl-CoA hydratase